MTTEQAPSADSAATASGLNKPSRPAISIVPFDPARDTEPFVRTMTIAFDGTDVNKAMWPEPQPSIEDRIRWQLRQHQRSTYVAPETVRRTALVDGKPVGFGIWSSPRDLTATEGEPTDEEKAASKAREAELESTKEAIDREAEGRFNLTFFKAFKKAMADGRKQRYKGRPFWLLEILCVDPAAQGLGVGKALLSWGFERADRDKLPIYLEATAAGKPVYERSNFEVVGDIVFPGGQPGTELSLPAMERPPQPIPSDATDADAISLSRVEDADWPEVMRAKLLAMDGDPRSETSSPLAQRPDFETQVQWAVYSQRRMPPDVARTIEFVKATRRGRILGFAAWYKPIPSTVADPPADPAPSASDPTEPIDEALEAIFAASEDRAFRQDFKTRARQIREDYHAGRPYWYLGGLIVHPDAQGQGIGKKLITWGLEQADAAGLPVHCESSPAGQHVYPRLGFEPIGWLDWTYIDGTPMRAPSYCRQPAQVSP